MGAGYLAQTLQGAKLGSHHSSIFPSYLSEGQEGSHLWLTSSAFGPGRAAVISIELQLFHPSDSRRNFEQNIEKSNRAPASGHPR